MGHRVVGLLALRLDFGNYDATYGSLGGIIVMLLWMYISAVVLLFGAESNAVIEHKSEDGKRAGAKRLAESGRTGSKTQELEPAEPAGSFGTRARRGPGGGGLEGAGRRRPGGARRGRLLAQEAGGVTSSLIRLVLDEVDPLARQPPGDGH